MGILVSRFARKYKARVEVTHIGKHSNFLWLELIVAVKYLKYRSHLSFINHLKNILIINDNYKWLVVPAGIFSLVQNFIKMQKTYIWVWHLTLLHPIRLRITSKYLMRLKIPDRVKPSSLFRQSLNDEGKKVLYDWHPVEL